MHFSPLADPEFIDVEDFRRDFERMGELFAYECEYIKLLGGEPLLHPEVNTLMKIARENFQHGIILLVTNGILLLQMSDDFWRTCHDNNITVAISKYPINLDMPEIRNRAAKFGVSLQDHGGAVHGDVTHDMFGKIIVDLEGKHNMSYNFARCPQGVLCTCLSKGKLYNCFFSGNIRHFNKYFKQNIPLTEEDYIDIYSDIDGKTILQKLIEPKPICHYCNLEARTLVPWAVSKREISEWS